VTIKQSETLRIAVIADQGQVQKFAVHALDQISGCEEITVSPCENTRIRRRMLKHGAYYRLNLLLVRNPPSGSVPLVSGRKRVTESVSFDSLYDGAWQILPHEIVERLANSGFDVVLKFGLSLMRVPSAARLSVPILPTTTATRIIIADGPRASVRFSTRLQPSGKSSFSC
jgi:hypothetical protein